jgi:CO dehydrogenase maturation factor
MGTTIAISGKGGSGKTTLAAMIIRSLLAEPIKGPIFAVDADPNACLALTLGIEPGRTIAEIREEVRAKPASDTGVDRLRSLEYRIQAAITEAAGFDLLTMGRPEGPDCYCAANNMLRQFLDKLSSQYQFVIVDNEAGMEHLSRRTTNNVDVLCIVAEPIPIGALTARRISQLANQLPISVKHIGVIWNKCESDSSCESRLDDIETLGYVPTDTSVLDASGQGKTVFDIQEDSPAYLAVQKIVKDKLTLKYVEGSRSTGTRS